MCHSHYFYEEHLLIPIFNAAAISEFREITRTVIKFVIATFYAMKNILLHIFDSSGYYSKYFNFLRKT